MPKPVNTFIALGSNLNNPKQQVTRALAVLTKTPNITLVKASKLYQTKPWGNANQPDFINACAHLTTTLSPLALLDTLLGIENTFGRTRSKRWGPRILDLDILLYDKQILNLPHLTIPHPHLSERDFVLIPLLEIAPHLTLPNQELPELDWQPISSFLHKQYP